jgi:hypothetical protein
VLILIIAPAQRQSGELLRTTRLLHSSLPIPPATISESTGALELANGSRVLSLPAREDTIRGFSDVALIVIDEAARFPDELYYALRPMLAVRRTHPGSRCLNRQPVLGPLPPQTYDRSTLLLPSRGKYALRP